MRTPDVKYVSGPANLKQNRPPTEGMTVSLHDLTGTVLYRVDLPPA